MKGVEMMTVKFNTSVEAFAAISWIICTADGFGTVEERGFFFDQMQSHDVFKDLSSVEFQQLLGTMFIRLFPSGTQGEFSIMEEGGADLITAFREVLTPELRMEAWRMAVGLAHADELCDVEETLLEQLRLALELDVL